MPDRHHLQNSYLKEHWYVCAYCIRDVCFLQGSATVCFLLQILDVSLHFEHRSSIKIACCLLWSLPTDLQRRGVAPCLTFLTFTPFLLWPWSSLPRHAPPPAFPPPPWTCSRLKEIIQSSSKLFPSVSTYMAPCIHSILRAKDLHWKRLFPSINCLSNSFFVTSSPNVSPRDVCSNGCLTFDTLLASPLGFSWSAAFIRALCFLCFFFSSGHLCVGFALCSRPLRLHRSDSDGSVSLGLQPHRENPGGLSVRGGRKVKVLYIWSCWIRNCIDL